MRLNFSQYSQLQSVGGSVAVQAPGYSDPSCGQPDIVVVNQAAGNYIAVSAACPHACCTVQYTGSNFYCPCHGAQFDTTGKSAGIRTNQPLAKLTVCADTTGVTVSW